MSCAHWHAMSAPKSPQRPSPATQAGRTGRSTKTPPAPTSPRSSASWFSRSSPPGHLDCGLGPGFAPLPKRHFCDPSLAAAALQAGPARLLRDLNYFGFLFESLVVRDLRVYAQNVGASVFHYRDNIGEVDVVIDDGTRWGAFEVKLGITYADEAATSLKKFVERIDTEQHGQPAFLGVVVPTRYGYTRDDGIQVIPVQALGP